MSVELKQRQEGRSLWIQESWGSSCLPTAAIGLVRGTHGQAAHSAKALHSALCLCEGIYNPAIHAARLILSSVRCLPAPGVFPLNNSDVGRKG